MGRGKMEGNSLYSLGWFQDYLLSHFFDKNLPNFLKSCNKKAPQYYEEGRVCSVNITVANYLSQFVGDFESQDSCHFKLTKNSVPSSFQYSKVFQGQNKEEKGMVLLCTLRFAIYKAFGNLKIFLKLHLCWPPTSSVGSVLKNMLAFEVEKPSFLAVSECFIFCRWSSKWVLVNSLF